MKIGILTQPLTNNYGGILQAYALQSTLEALGHKVVIINRKNKRPKPSIIILRIFSFVKSIFKRYILKDHNIAISNPLNEYYTNKEEWTFDDTDLKHFIKDKIKLSPPIRNSIYLKLFVKTHKLDCLIVGSDQVWREDYSPKITDYFLGFLSDNDRIKRIAYAASFGLEQDPIGPNALKKCIRLAQMFTCISVRENSGVTLMKRNFGIEAKLVLDPTLLLNVDFYNSLIKKNDISKNNLISYILDSSDEKKRIISEVRNTFNYETYSEILLFPFKKISTGKSISISQWLSSFANADFIITDSFHGCIFSIIYRKPFIAIANENRGLDRFLSLLCMFGLEDRLIFSLTDLIAKKNKLLSKPNYQLFDPKYKELKELSMKFLKEGLTI